VPLSGTLRLILERSLSFVGHSACRSNLLAKSRSELASAVDFTFCVQGQICVQDVNPLSSPCLILSQNWMSQKATHTQHFLLLVRWWVHHCFWKSSEILKSKWVHCPTGKRIECQKFSLKWSLVQFDPLCLCFHDCSLQEKRDWAIFILSVLFACPSQLHCTESCMPFGHQLTPHAEESCFREWIPDEWVPWEDALCRSYSRHCAACDANDISQKLFADWFWSSCLTRLCHCVQCFSTALCNRSSGCERMSAKILKAFCLAALDTTPHAFRVLVATSVIQFCGVTVCELFLLYRHVWGVCTSRCIFRSVLATDSYPWTDSNSSIDHGELSLFGRCLQPHVVATVVKFSWYLASELLLVVFIWRVSSKEGRRLVD